MWHIAGPSGSAALPLAAGAGALAVIVLLIVTICMYITCKKKKEKKKTVEDMTAVDENPVYQQYELVGPNYERQYSTHEVVDNNDYYG